MGIETPLLCLSLKPTWYNWSVTFFCRNVTSPRTYKDTNGPLNVFISPK